MIIFIPPANAEEFPALIMPPSHFLPFPRKQVFPPMKKSALILPKFIILKHFFLIVCRIIVSNKYLNIFEKGGFLSIFFVLFLYYFPYIYDIEQFYIKECGHCGNKPWLLLLHEESKANPSQPDHNKILLWPAFIYDHDVHELSKIPQFTM